MSLGMQLDRRAFMKSAGASFAAVVSGSALAYENPDMIFASAYKGEDGSFGVILLNEMGGEIARISLPGRGHDITFNRTNGQGVVFARRPGNFALVFDVNDASEPVIVIAPNDRHFYGHGAFSHDGKLLYAAENDFENALGKIGVYDTTNRFKRVGEFESHGIGPHEIMMLPDQDMLVIANGGIETHPDFGRAKLNISAMQPSIVFLYARNGGLIEAHSLPTHLHKLSMRHLDIAASGRVVFGCQYEGSKRDTHPLIGSLRLGEEIRLWDTPAAELRHFGNYVGSVAISRDQQVVAATLPKADRVAFFSLENDQLHEIIFSEQGFGVSQAQRGFLISSTGGDLLHVEGNKSTNFQGVAFDNHISRFE